VHAFKDRDHSAPYDLELKWGRAEGQVRFRGLLRRFSQLLYIWPEMVEQVKILHAKDIRMCGPVNSEFKLSRAV